VALNDHQALRSTGLSYGPANTSLFEIVEIVLRIGRLIPSRLGHIVAFFPCWEFRFKSLAASDPVERIPILAEPFVNQTGRPDLPPPLVRCFAVSAYSKKAVLPNQFPNDFLVVREQVGIAHGKFHEAVSWFDIPQMSGHLTETIPASFGIGQVKVFERGFESPLNEAADCAALPAGRDLAQVSQLRIEPNGYGYGLSAWRLASSISSAIGCAHLENVRLHVDKCLKLLRFVRTANGYEKWRAYSRKVLERSRSATICRGALVTVLSHYAVYLKSGRIFFQECIAQRRRARSDPRPARPARSGTPLTSSDLFPSRAQQ
jgi:hypothetical protein